MLRASQLGLRYAELGDGFGRRDRLGLRQGSPGCSDLLGRRRHAAARWQHGRQGY
jgi:hypothetical protein